MNTPGKLTKQGVRDLGGNRPIVPTCSHSRWTAGFRKTQMWNSERGVCDAHVKARVCVDCGKLLKVL